MANDIVQSLIDRYGAKEWLEPEARDVNVLAWRYVPLRLEGKWRQARVRVRERPAVRRGSAIESIAPSAVRITDSVWQAGDEDAPMVHVTTFETASRAEARAWLLRTLAEFQAPNLERSDLGEVAFVSEGHAAGAFVRGNVVFFVRNAGRELTPIKPILKSLDATLAEEPKRFKRPLDIPTPSGKAGKATILELPAPDVSSWYRIVVRGAEPRIEKGRTVLIAPAGTANVTVVQESAEGAAGTKLTVEFR
ncbi:MAG TPA: hypothetical protein VEK57_22790 [Thermoanaerobaculia bacterium]|nr:hypothetical protein [Thermoanaerobaculia bacterium]